MVGNEVYSPRDKMLRYYTRPEDPAPIFNGSGSYKSKNKFRPVKDPIYFLTILAIQGKSVHRYEVKRKTNRQQDGQKK